MFPSKLFSSKAFTAGLLSGLVVIFLTGCGGGGGGGGSDNVGSENPGSGSGAVPPSYGGPTSPARIDEGNVVELAKSIVAAAAISDIAESFWVNTPYGTSNQKEKISGSEGGSVTVEITAQGTGDTYKVVLNFSNYTEHGITADGLITQSNVRQESEGGAYIYSYISGTQTFDSFTLKSSEMEMLLNGTVEGSGPNSSRLLQNLLLVDRLNNRELKLDSFTLDRFTVGEGLYQHIATEVSGALYDSKYGKLEISTERRMAEFGLDENRPFWSGRGNGLFHFKGDGRGALLGLNGTTASVLVDGDRDGELERGVRLGWDELALEEVFEPLHLAQAPISNAGSALTSWEGLDTFLHGSFSHDPDKEFLSYQWELVAKPADSTFELGSPTTPYFSFTPDLPGDFLFNLYVSDGQHRSRSAVKVTVHENTSPYGTFSISQESAGLEVTPPDSGQIAYALDASSGQNTAWDESNVKWVSDAFDDKVLLGTETGNLLNTATPLKPYGQIFSVEASGQDFSSSTIINSGDAPFVVKARLELITTDVIDSITTSDLDKDGDSDIIALYHGGLADTFFTKVFINNRNGEFNKQSPIPSGEKFVTTGDLNGDDRDDIVSTTGLNTIVSWQNPDGTFSTPTELSFGDSPCTQEDNNYASDVAIADIDADGDKDLVVLRNCAETELIYWTQGDYGLSASPTRVTLLTEWALDSALADLNNDKRIDVVLLTEDIYTSDSEYIQIFSNDTEGFIQTSIPVDFWSSDPGIAAGDLNGDNLAEIILLNADYISVHFQNADGSFSEEVIINEVDFHWGKRNSVQFSDLNSDGRTDLLFTSSLGINAAINLGEDGFSLSSLSNQFNAPRDASAAVADINLDGANDIILTSGGTVVGYGGLTYYSQPVK